MDSSDEKCAVIIAQCNMNDQIDRNVLFDTSQFVIHAPTSIGGQIGMENYNAIDG